MIHIDVKMSLYNWSSRLGVCCGIAVEELDYLFLIRISDMIRILDLFKCSGINLLSLTVFLTEWSLHLLHSYS